jgi:hypothetical protein
MELAEKMQDPEFWRKFGPNMNTSGLAIGPSFDVPTPTLDILHREMTTIGYTQIDNVLPVEEINEILRAMKAMREAGVLPIFAFAFDETWGLFLRLNAIWKRLLGPDWHFMPALWGWWIEQGPTGAGWPAHRDRGKQVSVREDGTPMSISVWIPLTRALPSNGCMYVLPKGLEFEKLNLKTIQNARALPASPGTALMWNQSVWHWSGTSSRRAPNPRVSISLELQTASVPPFQEKIFDPSTIPMPLPRRLALIGQQIMQYRHFTKLEGEPVELANALQKYA